MRTLQSDYDHGKHSTVSLEVAIKNLRFTDEVSNFKKSLIELRDEWLSSESASERHIRATMMMRLDALDILLSAIENDVCDGSQNCLTCDEKQYVGKDEVS